MSSIQQNHKSVLSRGYDKLGVFLEENWTTVVVYMCFSMGITGACGWTHVFFGFHAGFSAVLGLLSFNLGWFGSHKIQAQKKSDK